MIDWLKESLSDAGLWKWQRTNTVSVRVTARFEVYLLGDSAGHTQLVVKIPRETASAALLEHEHRLLMDLHAHTPTASMGLAPVSYGKINVEGMGAWVQSALPGRQVHPQFREETFARVASWRGTLASMTRGELLGETDLFYEGLDESNGLQERLELGWRLANVLKGTLPSVLVHGDLHPTNLLVSRDSIGAVDWVWATPGGRPLFDWFDFCTHLCYEADWTSPANKRWANVTRALLNPGERLHGFALSGAQQVTESLRIPPDTIQLQLSLYACSRLHALIGHHLPILADELFLASLPVLKKP